MDVTTDPRKLWVRGLEVFAVRSFALKVKIVLDSPLDHFLKSASVEMVRRWSGFIAWTFAAASIMFFPC